MNKIMQLGLASLAGVGLWAGATAPAMASSRNYSAARSASVRLIWRTRMGAHVYHNRATGARYSEHLGVRYGLNQATTGVTWITDAHEKLYNRDTKTEDIYYHVHNQNETTAGWIWRGYLIPGGPTGAAQSTPSSATQGLTLADFAHRTPLPDSPAQQAVAELGHGATLDPQYTAFAQYLMKNVLLPAPFANTNAVSAWMAEDDDTGDRPDNVLLQKLLRQHGIVHFGYGPNRYQVMYMRETNQGWSSYMNLEYHNGPDEGAYGIDGITSANYFTPVKIGYTVEFLPNNKVATLIIMNYPAKYGQVHEMENNEDIPDSDD